ncbi:1472_t:CDS:2 [Entrophospora sp. SA101]|nr:1472_t:CDS:2 [Entrophospora sp. SA101]
MNPTNNSIEESNFPIDPVIKYTNKGSISNNFNYEVIELGYYPETFKITCGKNGYAILDEYKVKTTFGKNIITCSIYYNENDSPVFLIDWIKDDENFNVYSENSTTDASDLYFMKLGSNLQKSGILMFGLQLECLKNYREQNPLKEKCQRLRVISVGQDIRQTFESSESSALNINKDLEQASLIKTIFEANDICYELSYDKKNSNVEEAIVKVMDEHNISRDSYRALAAIIHSLPHEYVIEKRRNKINQIITEKVPISTFNTSRENPVENDTSDVDNDSGNDTEEEINENIIVAEESLLKDSDESLYIRISGDGRNVERKIKHVMITFALLNDHENIFNPNYHYSLVIYTGQEDYECLKNVLNPLIQELNFLKKMPL